MLSVISSPGLVRPGVILMAALLTAGSVGANEWRPQDFAYGITITPGDDSALQAVELPAHYYQHSARRGGGDLRVFDSAGQPVPHLIESPVSSEFRVADHQLPLFPVYAPERSELDSLSLQLERRADGSLINISSQSPATSPDVQVIAYIIDASQANQRYAQARLSRLSFNWSEPEYGVINQLQLDASDNLNDWLPLSSGQSLSRLEYAGQTLGKKDIKLAGRTGADYLRLSWPAGQSPVILDSVNGRYTWTQLNQAIELRMLPVPITPVSEALTELEAGAYIFATGGQFPLEQLSFTARSDGGNQFFSGSLYTRLRDNSRWLKHSEFEQFVLNERAGKVTSEAHEMQRNRARHWLIRWTFPPALAEQGLVSARLGWRPERLLLLAQGQPPFTLAYGNPEVPALNDQQTRWFYSLPEAMQKPDAPVAASLGDPLALGGPVLQHPTGQAPNWRKILLWSVLVIGVLLMLWMASRLYQQMNQADRPEA